MSLVFLHNSLLACLLSRNAQIPVSHALWQPNKSRKPACCPSPLSDSTHESLMRLCICVNESDLKLSCLYAAVLFFSVLNIILHVIWREA